MLLEYSLVDCIARILIGWLSVARILIGWLCIARILIGWLCIARILIGWLCIVIVFACFYILYSVCLFLYLTNALLYYFTLLCFQSYIPYFLTTSYSIRSISFLFSFLHSLCIPIDFNFPQYLSAFDVICNSTSLADLTWLWWQTDGEMWVWLDIEPLHTV